MLLWVKWDVPLWALSLASLGRTWPIAIWLIFCSSDNTRGINVHTFFMSSFCHELENFGLMDSSVNCSLATHFFDGSCCSKGFRNGRHLLLFLCPLGMLCATQKHPDLWQHHWVFLPVSFSFTQNMIAYRCFSKSSIILYDEAFRQGFTVQATSLLPRVLNIPLQRSCAQTAPRLLVRPVKTRPTTFRIDPVLFLYGTVRLA